MRLAELKEVDTLIVFKKGEKAGELKRTDQGSSFEYDDVYLANGGSDIAFTFLFCHLFIQL